MGPRPDNKTLDRKDNEKHYTPNNCRWVSNLKQQRNKSNNVLLEYRGKLKSVSEWANIFNMNVSTLRERLKKGMPVNSALTTPVRRKS